MFREYSNLLIAVSILFVLIATGCGRPEETRAPRVSIKAPAAPVKVSRCDEGYQEVAVGWGVCKCYQVTSWGGLTSDDSRECK